MNCRLSKFSILIGLAGIVAAALVSGQGRTLDIYFIDTEGGQSTLLVSPTGGTFMIDTGYAGKDTQHPDEDVARDAHRIQDVARIAGVTQIDALVATHFHGDHASGVKHLTEVLPVRRFVDHGPALFEVPTMKQRVGEYSEYWATAFAKGEHQVAKPGDTIPVAGLDIRVVQALGKPINVPGDSNSYCREMEKLPDSNPEDTASLGVVVQYGMFRFSNFGDLPRNLEIALLCPTNRVGRVDVYETPSHGRAPSPAVAALMPRIAVFDNGAMKGGGAASLKAFKAMSGFEDVWQLHKNLRGEADGNPPDAFIANLDKVEETMHAAHHLRVSAQADGSFTVFNSRTGATKTYAARQARN